MSQDDEKTDLPDLTERQYKYVCARQSGKNKSDSLRAATDTSRMAPSTIWRDAIKLENNPKVRAWLDLIKVEQISEATYTKEAHLEAMQEAARVCKENGSWSAMVKALESLGKCAGHYVDKTEITHIKSADTDMLDKLEQMLGSDARKKAERKLGLH